MMAPCSTRIDIACPVGDIIYQPTCKCGWKGEATPVVYRAVAETLLHTQLVLFED